MQTAKIEQDYLPLDQEVERFKEDVRILKAQLAELKQKDLGSSVLIQKLGRIFGFGAAGKLGWVRFKLKYKQEELERRETERARLDVITKRSDEEIGTLTLR